MISQRKVSIGKEFKKFSCERKETVDIDILVTSRNGDGKIMQSIRITSWNSLGNKKAQPVQPVQMNIYQSNTYRKHLRWLYVDDEPRVQERQQVKDQ